MANANATLLPAKKSKPELLAQWLFKNTANWRNLLGFVLVVLLSIISIKFNIELGKLSAVDDTSRELLPVGYALLDLSALFLSGYITLKTRSKIRKALAMAWFVSLLSLSLWAAASFTLSVDARASQSDLIHAIEQKKLELESINAEVLIWRENVANAEVYKTKHQKTLENVQARQRNTSDELHQLEQSLPNSTMAIYEMIAPLVGITPAALNTIVRLLWAAALTLSPVVIIGLIGAELVSNEEPENKTEKKPKVTTDSASKPIEPDHVPAVQGHNMHTPIELLNGLKHARQYLLKTGSGRVTRAKIASVAQLKSRESVSKVIETLISERLLTRANNGQLMRVERVGLTLVK